MKTKKIIILTLALILTVGTVFFLFDYKNEINKNNQIKTETYPENALLGGIEYEGYYTRINPLEGGKRIRIPKTLLVSVNEVLNYWNDERINLSNDDLSINIDGVDDKEKYYIDGKVITAYLKTKGYEARFIDKFDKDEVLKIIKELVGEKKAPVVVFQKNNKESISRAYRLVIGYSDETEKIITHDFHFGPNYEISYNDFVSLFDGGEVGMFSLWPSSDLKAQLKIPDYDKQYPERSEKVNLATKLFSRHIDMGIEDGIEGYEKFVEDELFSDALPSIYQIHMYCTLGSKYLAAEEYDKTIEFFNNKVLPVNRNLDKNFDGFSERLSKAYNYQENDSLWPYQILLTAYLKKGDRINAERIYNERMSLVVKDKPMHPRLLEMEKLLKKK